ncbi:phospholipase effector Tle1 domain-containing protein [Vibrio rumoiensis]|uniref:Phospholipase effector Tle1 domain-containing protein n=1 Tax=Vibrio rumoiensis TaxID=76258 RepID=A0ABW7IZJ9_9VIBR
MGMLEVNSHCVACEKRTHWAELYIVDEHNQPFNNVSGHLIDSEGTQHPITLNGSSVFITGLSAGRFNIELEADTWLRESQQRTPFVMKASDSTSYTVQSGDSLSKIASQYGMTLDALLTLNPQYQSNPDLIVVGDEIILNSNAETDPIQDWLANNPVGYQQKPRKLINVTSGDFLTAEQAQDLSDRHQAKKADTESLIVDQSYLLRVHGFNYITLRFGLFFDGTANNTYSAQWGKQQLEGYYSKWQQLLNSEGNKPVKEWQSSSYSYPNQEDFYWFWQDDQKVESSAANELTNIQKLYERYMRDEFNSDKTVFYHPEYITGIGTGNSTEIAKADESLKGQALGLGEYGVEAKVTTSIQSLSEHFESIATSMRNIISIPIDGINKVELDVFGFSRGAAAARHFINVAIDGEQGEFVPQFVAACQQNELALQAGFDWASNEHCEVTFAGLFDTVAAIADFSELDFTPHNQDNGNIRLWLDPKRVRHAVHLTASPKTEYRYNFSSNKLNSADNFHEIIVYGAHSDVGGGYYSQYAFDQKEYLLPLIERKRIKRITRTHDWSENDRAKQRIEQALQQVLGQEVKQGWNADDYIISVKTTRSRVGKGNRYQTTGELVLQRLVQGDLSRLYLRVMYGLAESMQVPLSEVSLKNNKVVWNNEKESSFIVPELISGNDSSPAMTFGKLCDAVLQMSKKGNIAELTTYLSSSKFLDAFMRYNLIHHSSDDGIANHPNINSQGAFDREQYDPTV